MELPQGGEVKVIAGRLELDGDAPAVRSMVAAPSSALIRCTSTCACRPGRVQRAELPPGHNAFLYTYEGSAYVGPAGTAEPLPHRAAGVLSDGDGVRVHAGAAGACACCFWRPQPLREPVVQYGPFVMNTREEIEQAIADYRNGLPGHRSLTWRGAREAGEVYGYA